jgi:hypothetical protein
MWHHVPDFKLQLILFVIFKQSILLWQNVPDF